MTDMTPADPPGEWSDEMMHEYEKWVRRWQREHDKVVRLTAALAEREQENVELASSDVVQDVVRLTAALRDAVSTWTDTMTYAEHNRRKMSAEAALAGETTDTPRAQE